MIPKLTSEAYTFTITENDGFHIELVQTKTGKVKKFFQKTGNLHNLTNHMNSLTDDQCQAWFKGR